MADDEYDFDPLSEPMFCGKCQQVLELEGSFVTHANPGGGAVTTAEGTWIAVGGGGICPDGGRHEPGVLAGD
jgi:hypothetical protein